MRLIKTHGSLNEIFALEARPDAWGSDAELRAFVRTVCDRGSWTGGSDGIYLYDASGPNARAWFFNPDGSSAEFCGNGMRGLGRLILDLRGTDTEVVASGGRDYTVHRAPSTPEGANVSFLQSLDDVEVFVRTFERGAGLTPSCGSGVVASRAAYSNLTGLDPARRLVVRNAGGVAAASIQIRDGAWYPVLEGNATVVYRAEVDARGDQSGPIEYATDENAAYSALDQRNTAYLKERGISTARP